MLVLVGYASEYGSTREIGARIADHLAKHASTVEVLSLQEVRDAGKYDAFVLGSAIHNGAWLGQATQFLDANRSLLAGRPVWLFSVGMPAALPRPVRELARRKEESVVIAEWRDVIHPRDHRLFSGVFQQHHNVSLPGRLFFAAMRGRYGDFRQWPEIDSWAGEIARGLAAATPGAHPRSSPGSEPDSSS